MTQRNNFSQYFLLRNGIAPPVCSLDGNQMLGLDVMDQQQAIISRWNANQAYAHVSRPQFMEPLPCQQIRFSNASNRFTSWQLDPRPQAKDGFQRFSINK